MTQREPEPGWGREDIERKNEEEEPDPRVERDGRPEADVPRGTGAPPPAARTPVGDLDRAS